MDVPIDLTYSKSFYCLPPFIAINLPIDITTVAQQEYEKLFNNLALRMA